VHAGEALIQALGTQFDVYRRPDATTTVAVIEGRVQVLHAAEAESSGGHTHNVLAAGEEAQLAPGGKMRRQAVADVASTVAWRQRRLIFRRNTLAEVISEFNRYNRAPRFRLVGDEALAGRHYSGEFDADDPESLLQLLAGDPKLSVARNGDDVFVRAH
jgi:ferric-dicitrate binding protein FerR (iron transport regulator)